MLIGGQQRKEEEDEVRFARLLKATESTLKKLPAKWAKSRLNTHSAAAAAKRRRRPSNAN